MWPVRSRKELKKETATGFDFGQEIVAQRFKGRRLTRQQTQESTDVVYQFESHRLLIAVQLQNGRSLSRPRSWLLSCPNELQKFTKIILWNKLNRQEVA
jgi:hypothetical protein